MWQIPIRLKLDLVLVCISDDLGCLLTPSVLDDFIGIAVTHEERSILVCVICFLDKSPEFIAKEQITRQTKHAAEFVFCGQASEYRDGTTLRESTEDDFVRR